MEFLTDFADEAVVLPVALLVGVVLLIQGWRRGAVAWGLAVAGTLATMLALKLVCDWQPMPGLRSPSGHVAVAAAIYGGLAAMLLAPPRAAPAAALALAWAALVAVTRLALGAHTVPEVLVGGAVGILGAATLRVLAGTRPSGIKRERLAMAALVAALAMHGQHMVLEHDIGVAARVLRQDVAGSSTAWAEGRGEPAAARPSRRSGSGTDP